MKRDTGEPLIAGHLARCGPRMQTYVVAAGVLGNGSCIDDESLFALARGKLAGGELSRVETHLRDCADCRAVLAEAARGLESPSADALTSQDPPARIARYQVVSLIGAGASGVVYRGFDPRLKRTVALKVLRPDLYGKGPDQSARMLREAQSMARLSDPHVVAVYDVGLNQGKVYLVMEYIDGATLSEWLRAGPRTRTEILSVFADAGRGLSAAHDKGLVHRDFKPENVLVARDGRARVTDFGLARESENWLGNRTDDQASAELYAPTRGLVGTPAYMAPELFEGGLATPASDQFAFCVTLFVALFDKHPFKAGEGIALSELMTRVRATTLQTPALQTARDERLFAVLRRGLAAEPASRFPDMPRLLSELSQADRRAGKRGLMVVALLILAALLGLGLRWQKPVVHTESLAVPAPPAPRQPTDIALSAADPAPLPVVSQVPKSAASSAAPREKRRPAPKPGDVRYKDWLKEPF
jgi:eukaryotic-like serine/threonine-protein kinase